MAGLTYDEVINLWVKAGGSPQSAAMAAAVADASSGLNPDAVNTKDDGSVSRGLFQISSALNALSTTDALSNTRAAVSLSNGGTDFSKWCSTWSDNDCGNSGGTYLGAGSNALAALAQRGGKYQVIGGVGVTSALQTGESIDTSGSDATDQPATDDTSDTTPATSTSGSPKIIVFVLLLVIAAVGYYYLNRKGKASPPASSE